MYDPVGSLRSARRQMDAPDAVNHAGSGRVVLGRLRKLLAEYLPGMSSPSRPWREALSVPLQEPPLERERLFALGWLDWLEGDWTAAENLFAEADSRCRNGTKEKESDDSIASDLPALAPDLLMARSAYWCARVRVLLGRPDAVAGYESVMRQLGGSPQATAWYVDLLWRAGRIDRAEQVWKSVRANKRVLACDEGPLLEARSLLRKGEPGPAEKLLREASSTNGVVWVERCLLSCWALGSLRQAERAAEMLRLAGDGPYPRPALAVWGRLLKARGRNEGVALQTDSPGWQEFVHAQEARAQGQREEAAALYRSALEHGAAQPFARFGLLCLEQDDPAAVLACAPGLFFALRCRARQAVDRFRRRETPPGELMEALQQSGKAGCLDSGGEHFLRLAATLQNRHPDSSELVGLVAIEQTDAAKRNAVRIVLEQAARRLPPGEALPVLRHLAGEAAIDATLREHLGRQLLRQALLLPDPAVLAEAEAFLPGNALLPPARALLANGDIAEDEGAPAGVLWRLARLPGGSVDRAIREKMRTLRTTHPRYRGVAQALLFQEAASRGDLAAVGEALEDTDAWRAFRGGPPRFVLGALEALAVAHPGHPVWRRSLPRWLQLWDASALGGAAGVLFAVAGVEVPGGARPSGCPAPAGVDPGGWFLHQAARALQSNDAVAALAFTRRALADGAALPSADVVQAVLPSLERRADAQGLLRCLGESGAQAELLTDLVDLLRGSPEGEAVLQAARREDAAAVRVGLEALGGKPDLPGRLHHHLALLAWRAAHGEQRDEAERIVYLRQAWRSWMAFLASPDGPPETERGMLLDHLLGVHRRRINDLLARGESEPARLHWELVQALPDIPHPPTPSPKEGVGWVESSRPTSPPGGSRRLDPPYKEDLLARVAKFRDDLATEYLLTTREAMRHGAIPEGWRSHYDRGLSLLQMLLNLDCDNVRLLIALVEVCGKWFIDLYNTHDAQLREEVERYTPFALRLARLTGNQQGGLLARSALAEFTKFRGFVEADFAAKIDLYRQALRFDPGNGNVRELLRNLGVNDPDADASTPERSDDV